MLLHNVTPLHLWFPVSGCIVQSLSWATLTMSSNLCYPGHSILSTLKRSIRFIAPHPLNCKLTIHQVNTLCYNLVHTCSPSTLKVGTCSIPWALCDKQYFGESDTKFTSYIISNPENIVISEKQAIRWLVTYLYFFLPLMSTSADWWNESAAQFQP